MTLDMNLGRIPGGFRGNARFSGKKSVVVVVSGDLGPRKAFV